MLVTHVRYTADFANYEMMMNDAQKDGEYCKNKILFLTACIIDHNK